MNRFTHTLPEELRRAAQEAPDQPFIRMLQGEWSFRQVDDGSSRLAAGLQQQGVAPGHTVSLLLPNSIEFVLAWFAIAKRGAITAPVNTAFRGAVLASAINLVQSRLLIVHASLLPLLDEVHDQLTHVAQVVVVGAPAMPDTLAWDALLVDTPLPALEPPAHFSDLALLLYTSGTTGRSKAAMISHRYVLRQGQAVIDGLGLRRDDVLYCPYPMFHMDSAIMTIAPALVLRAVAAIGERFSVSRYWEEVRALQATVFDFMGATLTMLWKQAPSPRDRDHRARLGWGVPMPEWAPQFEQRFGCRLVELYGSTEMGAIIFTPLDAPRRTGSCGKPLGPWEVQLQDEDGFPVPAGTPGELVVRATEPSVLSDGYWAMPEATLAAWRNGVVPYRRRAQGRRRRLAVFHRPAQGHGAPARREHFGCRGRDGDRGPPRHPGSGRVRGAQRHDRRRSHGLRRAPGRQHAGRTGPRRLVPDTHGTVHGAAVCAVSARTAQDPHRQGREIPPPAVRFRGRLGPRGHHPPERKTHMKYVTLDNQGPVSIVTLNRPERLNAMSGALMTDLHQALTAAHADPDTRAIVFTGAGRAFCAGDDLKEFEHQSSSPAAVADMCDQIQQITRDILFGPKLVIGAIHGYAVGGGFEWVLNCDLTVAADNLVAFFPEMALGHFVTGGVTHLLPQTVGHQKAMELFVLGERIDAATLLQLGLVNRVVPLDRMMDTALALANQVASRSSMATTLLKRVMTTGLSNQLAGALELERQAAMVCFANPDTAERIAQKTQSH
jgi:crotonobetaine/carnitine-CoA ligase